MKSAFSLVAILTLTSAAGAQEPSADAKKVADDAKKKAQPVA